MGPVRMLKPAPIIPFRLTSSSVGARHGPGVADMKGGLALMLAALTAIETSPQAARLGYEVVIN